MRHISAMIVYYILMLVPLKFLVQIWIFIIFCVIFYLSLNFWPKNSKLTMLSTHIIKSTILSYSSTHQIALNKRCPQSSQYRNWPAYYNYRAIYYTNCFPVESLEYTCKMVHGYLNYSVKGCCVLTERVLYTH